MLIISFLTTALSIYFYVFLDNKLFYVIGIYISTILRGGVISSFIPHIMQIFGLKYFLTLGGLGRLFTQIFCFGAAALSVIISVYHKNAQELLFPYIIVSLVSIGFAIFGLVLAFYEDDDKFNFQYDNIEEKRETKEENKKNKKKGETREESEETNEESIN